MNQARTKALSDQMSFRSISECCIFLMFQFVLVFVFVLLLSFYYFLSVNAKFSVGNSLNTQKTFPMIPWGCR